MDLSALHHEAESNYSYAIKEKIVKIILKTKRDDNIKNIYLLYNSKYLFKKERYLVEIKNKISTKYHDYYYIYLKVEDVRIGYIFKIIDNDNNFYYYSENNILVNEEYEFDKCDFDYFQLPYINKIDIVKTNKKFNNRIFYQIFVDRFYDGEKEDNRVINDKINVLWGENDKITSNTFAGGNLKGITKKLDYLKEELGIDAIYLTPIFESYSNHKYETYDYYKIAKDFGDETTLKGLIKEAHKRDILIILDGVFNHIAYYSPIFEDVIKNGKQSKYYSWFIIHNNDEKIDLDNVNYETFGFAKYMPKLNLSNKEVEEYVINICKHYLKEYKIDGYRLDVADEIAHTFFKKLRFALKKEDENIFLINENWHNAHLSLDDYSEFDSVMNYPFTSALIDLLGFKRINEEEFVNRINTLLVRYKDASLHNSLNLVSSHDKARFINDCNKNENLALIGYSLLFLYPGIPMIYYGDEIGMDGNNDPDCRKMFIWDETKRDKVRFIFIKSLIDIHKKLDLNNEDYSFKLVYLKEYKLLKVTIYNKFNNNEIIINELINLNNEDINISSLLDDNKKILLSSSFDINEKLIKKEGLVIYK